MTKNIMEEIKRLSGFEKTDALEEGYIQSEFGKLKGDYFTLKIQGSGGGSTKFLTLSKEVMGELKKLLKKQKVEEGKVEEEKDLEEWGGRRSYPRDPYWLTAKYPGKDAKGKPFKKGERVFYYPNTKTFLTGKDAEKASKEFEAAKADEYNMTRGMY